MAKGKQIYVPKIVLTELDNIGTEHNINKQKDRFIKLVDYAQLGREVRKKIQKGFL